MREHRARRLADAGIVVVDEAGGVEHRLALAGRRGGGARRSVAGAFDEARAMKFRQIGAAIDAGGLLHRRPGQTVRRLGRPIRERGHGAGELAVAVGLDQLALHPGHLAFAELGGAIAQHEMREVDGPFMGRHVGAFRHEAHVAERAGIDDLGVILMVDPVDLAGARTVDEIEQPREAVAEIEAAPAAVADVEDAMHLRIDLAAVVEVGALPVELVARRGLEATFPHT